MFVDASVIVAILNQESGWEELSKQLSGNVNFYVSAMVRFEATQALARASAGSRKPTAEALLKARDLVDQLILEIGGENVPIGNEIGSRAIDASARYGKAVGHQADLNLGDCFAYACAKTLQVPLLYKGNDFLLTDLR
ncbi:type II toxin-antitoxin system VapC family toxin [Mesorhizobium sp. M2C.T.Ca.TU.002.02.1.1]|uniref:type II toxin-antitoxin system VapC family toxin n=1 Tax=Mesorhizobium sp. M2C.T.Ca.TU.002.02.1.1 TaxID=2496788 RepID=UPI000FCAD31F|nr:type II toxin-antitoxin system VapC family toxin [Mesorhizobium sp. M2C.T.Ca.TU.002.02.1.1]RUU54158.1 type II toxin-antitoxin system VapC family toxin [Mesorhizobium sp. M2C.T.Ca.TU.002.02.1.1]RUU69344.1 type II toxin-antitoxin system VapC family toxin [Mesorhizobium sp. M2C.T.Ca.TU.009.01.2.1]